MNLNNGLMVRGTAAADVSLDSPALSHSHEPAEVLGDSQSSFLGGAQIKVIGVGGGGGNAVEHMINRQVRGVEFICANTDAQALKRSGASVLLQLGLTGLGAGARPEVGQSCATEAEEDIRNALQGAQMVFITAGLGGGTGTGAAPIIARIAKDMGILTVGVVTKPFDFEGGRRARAAEEGVRQLEQHVDSLIVVLNDRLLEVLGEDVTQEAAFAEANEVLRSAVGGIANVIHIPGLINADFEDVRTVMEQPGRAMMGTAQFTGPDRASKAAEAAIACPLLEGIDLSGANGVLVLIAASRGTLKLSESRNIMNSVKRYAHPDAQIIMGAAYEDDLGDQLRVTVIATGLSAQRAPKSAVPAAPLRTAGDPIGRQPAVHDDAPFGMTGLSTPSAPMSHQVKQGSTQVPPLKRVTSHANFGGQGETAMPAVWRNNRTSAGAKIDAMVSTGMEDFEIPAFLRKQAD